VVGTSFANKPEIIKELLPGNTLILEQDKENVFDENAIKVKRGDAHLGYLNSDAAEIYTKMLNDHPDTKFDVFVDKAIHNNRMYELTIEIVTFKEYCAMSCAN